MNQSQSLDLSISKIQQEQLFPKQPPSSIYILPDGELQESPEQKFISLPEPIQIQKHESSENPLILKFLLMKGLLNRFLHKLKMKAYIMSRLFTPAKVHIFEELHFDYSNSFENSNHILIMWDLAVILFSIFSLWMISFSLNFDPCEFKSSQLMFFCVMGVVICDGLVMNNRAIISEGEVIKDHRFIFKSYLNQDFPYEIIYFITWILCYTRCLAQIRAAEEFILIIQIYLLIRKINFKYSAHYEIIFASGNSGIADLCSLVVSIYIFNHIIACIWIYVAFNSVDLGNTWILDRNLSDPWPIYITAFYWASMTMTTVGYGNIVPKNDAEIVAASVLIYISSCVFAYSMNSIGILLNNINNSKQEYKQNLVHMTTFMKNKDVEQSIQSRVRNYLKCAHDNTNQNLEQIVKIINTLPQNLKQELNQNINMKAMSQITQIITNFSLKTQTLLSERLEQRDCISGEIITKFDEYQNFGLYYIIKGVVQLRESKSHKLIQTLKQGDHFGQYSFYTGFPSQYYAVCPNICSIYKIHRQDIITVLKHNQNDFEKFHSIKDGLVFNQEFRMIDISCSICSGDSHETIDCPLISYKPDLEARVKSEYFLSQERRKVTRQNIKLRILSQFKKFSEDGNQFIISQQSFELDQQQSSAIGKHTSDYIQTHTQQSSNQVVHSELLQQQSSVKLFQATTKEVPIQPKENNLLQVTGTTQSKIKPVVQEQDNYMDSEVSSLELQFHQCMIDQLHSYLIYLPQNNIEKVLTQINRKYKCNFYISKKYSFHGVKKSRQLINKDRLHRAQAIINKSGQYIRALSHHY